MADIRILADLWDVIEERAANPKDGSYVTSVLLHHKGADKALEKVGEEAVEYIIAAKNGVYERTVSEAADLLFHILVSLRATDTDLTDVLEELERRRK
jgi:phosphoribosyl-ATP pyrophosphohydrolase